MTLVTQLREISLANKFAAIIEPSRSDCDQFGSNLAIAIEYDNYKNIAPFAVKVRSKLYDDVQWAARVFPRSTAEYMPCLCLSPRGAVTG